jgi:hypothetical protein
MRSFRHWTARYLLERVKEARYRRRNPDAPWLTPAAIDILDSWLAPGDVGLEWGSGRSTAWIGRRVARLVSVEHHAGWYEKVRVGLPPSVELRHCAVADPADEGCGYVRTAQLFENESLDFALVDGLRQLRSACACAALRKLKPGGLLVIDNANWFIPHHSRSPRTATEPFSPSWAELIADLARWRSIWTSNGVIDTAFWIKPSMASQAMRSDGAGQEIPA